MKLIRFGEFREEKPGILLESGLRKDCSAHFEDWNHDFFNKDGLSKLANMLTGGGDDLPDVPEDVRWGAPISRP